MFRSFAGEATAGGSPERLRAALVGSELVEELAFFAIGWHDASWAHVWAARWKLWSL